MSRLRCARAFRWPLLGIAIVALLGHVCVGVLHTDGVAEAAGHGPSAADEHEGDAVHDASCEAVAARAASTASVPVAYVDMAFVPYAFRLPAGVTVTIAQRAMSPPLFLLHAALLI